MNILQRRIGQAGRRVFWRTFFRTFFSTALGLLIVAGIAIAVPKIWAIGFLQPESAAQTWFWGWLGGAVGLSVIVGLAVALWQRRSPLQLAIEIDRRYRLRERLSSALAIDVPVRESPVGVALVEDANKRADNLELSEHFPIRVGKWAYSVLIPALAIVALSLVGNRIAAPISLDEKLTADARQQIIQAARESKMKIGNQTKPKPAEDPLAQTEQLLLQKLDDLANQDLDSKKDVLFKLSDMQAEIDKQKAKLGDVNALKRELGRLDSQDASAKELAEALRDGNLDEAQKAMRELIARIKAGELDQKTLEKLSQDFAEMAKMLEKAKSEFDQKEKDLSQDLEKALADGNSERAEQLKRELEKLQESRRQMEQLEKLAGGMRKVADKLAKNPAQGKANGQRTPPKPGDEKQQAAEGQKSAEGGVPGESPAAESANGEEMDPLEAMAEQIADLEAEMQQANRLDEMIEQVQCLKGACPGGDGDKRGDGLGKGRGEGDRPIDEDAANAYRSQVRSNVRPGETVKYGTAEGPNAPGVSRETIKQQIEASHPDEVDPQQEQKLTKAEREHLREYYQKLRGEK